MPDASFTVAGQNLANTFTLANTFSANGALSAPAVSFTGTPITGGTATTTKPLVLVETAGATSAGWSTSGTMLGVNAPSGFAGHVFWFGVNGSQYVNMTAGGVFQILSGGYYQFGSDTILSRKAAANLQLGAVDAAAPVAQTLSVQSVVAGTTDTAGANWTLNGSRGTGTGAGGSIIFQTAPAGSTGSSQNALVTSLTLASTGFVYIGNVGVNSPVLLPFSGATYSGYSSSGRGLSFYSNVSTVAGDDSFAITGSAYSGTSGTHNHLRVTKSFAPTSGTAVYNHLHLSPTINQTGGANGITRGLYINPTLTAAADFRALEISDGNVVLPKTVTAGGTTGAQTINKVTGSVNFSAAATSLVVTNSYVTTSSIIIATVATNDTTMKSVAVVAGAGSFTIYANAAATAETRVNFIVTN